MLCDVYEKQIKLFPSVDLNNLSNNSKCIVLFYMVNCEPSKKFLKNNFSCCVLNNSKFKNHHIYACKVYKPDISSSKYDFSIKKCVNNTFVSECDLTDYNKNIFSF